MINIINISLNAKSINYIGYLYLMPKILENHSIQHLNSFHLNVSARHFCECRSTRDILELLDRTVLHDENVLVLGEGSNILFSGDFRGLIIRPVILGREIIREDRENVWIKTGAGENWDDFVAWTTAWGYGGIENLSLIPGSVGASPIQNIGAYGMEVSDSIEKVSALGLPGGEKLTFSKEACRFAYRDSIFKQEWKGRCIISTVTFRLSKNPRLNLSYGRVAEVFESMDPGNVEGVRKAIIEIRRSKLPDPEKLGTAGSFFKNPVVSYETYQDLMKEYPGMPSYPAPGNARKIPAAWLIEQCGWKGKRLGDAACYEKQPLVIVNFGNATGKDILELAGNIQNDVTSRFGIGLEKEVNVV
jgi:UDP-N-acetylmuramate dehydrogenase